VFYSGEENTMKPLPEFEMQNPHSTESDQPVSVYFDGSCALCSLEIKHYASKSRTTDVAFVDVSAAQSDPCLGVSADAAMKRFHVRLSNGTVVTGARAFVALWKELPFWKHVAKVEKVPGALFVMECAYRAFLPIRPIMSRLVQIFGIKPINYDDLKS